METSKLVVPLGVGCMLLMTAGVGVVTYAVKGKPAPTPSPTPAVVASASPSPSARPSPRPSTYVSTVGGDFQFSEAGHRECGARMKRLGIRFVDYKQQNRGWPTMQAFGRELRICPDSRAEYRLADVDPSHAYLFCPGHEYRGQRSVYALKSRRWTTSLPQGDGENFLAAGFMLNAAHRPREALDQYVTSYSLAKLPGSVFLGMDAAIQCDDSNWVKEFSARVADYPSYPIVQAMRIYALAYLGRSDDALKVGLRLDAQKNLAANEIKMLVACVYLFREEYILADTWFSRSGEQYRLGWTWVSFFQQDFATSLSRGRAALASLGYGDMTSAEQVHMAVLSSIALGGSSEREGQEVLTAALKNSPKVWPYPLLRYLNREIDEQQIRSLSSFSVKAKRQTEWLIGTLKWVKGDRSEGAAILRNLPPHRYALELGMAKAWLKK